MKSVPIRLSCQIHRIVSTNGNPCIVPSVMRESGICGKMSLRFFLFVSYGATFVVLPLNRRWKPTFASCQTIIHAWIYCIMCYKMVFIPCHVYRWQTLSASPFMCLHFAPFLPIVVVLLLKDRWDSLLSVQRFFVKRFILTLDLVWRVLL